MNFTIRPNRYIVVAAAGAALCLADSAGAQQTALARRLDRDVTIIMVTPTLRDAAASGTQPSPDPVVYAVASKEGTAIRARAGYFVAPGLFADITMSSPVNTSRGLAITVDGLSQGTTVGTRLHRFMFRRCSREQRTVRCQDQAALEQTTKRYQSVVSARSFTKPDLRSERRQVLDLYFADVAADEQPWIKQTVLFTMVADVARPTTSYFTASASGPLKRQDWTRSFGTSVGLAAQRKPAGAQVRPHYYFGSTVSRLRQLVGPGTASYCYAVVESVATKCSVLATAKPELRTGVAAKFEARYWFNRNVAAGIELAHDSARRESSLQFPLQVFQSKASVDDPLGAGGGTASGGLVFEWTRARGAGSRFVLAAFVGTAFQFPQAPKAR